MQQRQQALQRAAVLVAVQLAEALAIVAAVGAQVWQELGDQRGRRAPVDAQDLRVCRHPRVDAGGDEQAPFQQPDPQRRCRKRGQRGLHGGSLIQRIGPGMPAAHRRGDAAGDEVHLQRVAAVGDFGLRAGELGPDLLRRAVAVKAGMQISEAAFEDA